MAELIMAHLAEVCLLLKKELFSAHAWQNAGLFLRSSQVTPLLAHDNYF